MPAVLQNGLVVAEGATPEAVGALMVENRIEVHEMTSSTESLEQLFFELTGGDGAQRGSGAGAMGDYRRFTDGAISGAPPPAGQPFFAPLPPTGQPVGAPPPTGQPFSASPPGGAPAGPPPAPPQPGAPDGAAGSGGQQ